MRLGTLSYLSVAICLYLGIASFSINKPLTLDQEDFAWKAGLIAYYGWDALGSTERSHGIAHPVLYHHLLAINYLILGETTVAARLLGVICFIAVLFLIMRLSKLLFPGDSGIRIGGLAAVLYAINPFSIQYSLLVDHDTTILPVFLLMFFCYFFRQNPEFTPTAVAKLSALFALCLWGKELTPYFMLVVLLPFLWLQRRSFIYAVSIATQIGLFGTAVFAATWTLYSILTGVPLLSFVEYSITGKAFNPAFHQARSVSRLFWGLAWSTGMVTPAVLILLASAALYRLLRLYQSGFQVRPTDYLWLYIALFWVITHLHISHPKYQYPLYSIAFILLAEYMYNALVTVSRQKLVFAVGLGLICAVVLASFVGDPILLPPIEYILFVFIGPFIISFLLLLTLRNLSVVSHTRFVLVMLVFLVATNVSLSLKQTASYTTATSWGEYGERGFSETLAYLRANVNGSVPIIRKDLGYYLTIDKADRQFSWIYNEIFRGDLNDPVQASQISDTLSRNDIQLVVLDRYTNRTGGQKKLLSSSFELVHNFGDFDVYRKSTKSPAGLSHLVTVTD